MDMVPSGFRMILRSVSAIVAGIFLWQQVVWAGGFAVKLDVPEPAVSGMAAERLVAAEDAAQTVIDIKQTVSDTSIYLPRSASGETTPHGLTYDSVTIGDDGWTRYYLDGALQERTKPDGTAYVFYYTTDGSRSEAAYYKKGGIYVYTTAYEYDTDGVRTGSVRTYANGQVREYDASGLMTKKTLASGKYYLYLEYFPNKKKKTFEYYRANGTLVQTYEYHYDADWSYAGRTITKAGGAVYEQDGRNRTVRITYAAGHYTLITYTDATGPLVCQKQFYGSDDAWQRTVEYWADGVTVRQETTSDPRPEADGDIVERSYDETGALLYVVTDGGARCYLDGREGTRVIGDDSSYTEYYYDENGVLVETHEFFTDGAFTVRDATGATTYTYTSGAALDEPAGTISVATATGDVVTYEGDAIVSVRLAADGSLLTHIELDEQGGLMNAVIIYSDGSRGVICHGALLQIERPGILTRYRDGRLATEYAPAVGLTSYAYEFPGNDGGPLVRAASGETISWYDQGGRPLLFRRDDGTVIEYGQGRLDRITRGGVVYKYRFIDDGNPRVRLKGTAVDVSLPVTVSYDSEGNILSALNGNGDLIDFMANMPVAVAGGESDTVFRYAFSATDAVQEVTIVRDGITRIYNALGELTGLSLDDLARITYENDRIASIEISDGTTVEEIDDMPLFSETGDLENALISYPDGSVALYNDDELLKIITASGSEIEYGDGKIRMVTLEDGSTYGWSYVDGYITIHDHGNNEKRTYRDGLLIETVTLDETGLITRYYYNDATDELERSEVCSGDDVLYAYTYTYDGGMTLVLDEDGNTQAYTKDKKLSYIIDAKGRMYSYTYVGKSEGHIEVYFPSGTKVRYDAQGRIMDVTCADGTIVRDISFSDEGVPTDFTYTRDGLACTVENGKLRKTIDGEGVETLFYDNGFVRSVATPSGEVTEYAYHVEDSATGDSSSLLASEALDHASFYLDAGTTHLTLSEEALLYGNGTDGVKHVTADETLDAGTYNFTSLTIDPDVTLTLAPGAVIKVLDTTTVYGAVFCGGSFAINAPTVIVDADGSITGGVAIRCDTIENAGIITGNAAMTGVLANGANCADADDNFSVAAHSFDYNPGAGQAEPRIIFPPCNLSSVMWHASGNGSGNSQGYAELYLYINGVKTRVSSSYAWGRGPGSFDTGVQTIEGPWENVTGIEYLIGTDSSIGVARVYGYEMQAIIGQPTIDYVHGDPGLVNTSISRPVATVRQESYPASGTFESDVIEIDALTLGAISWDQETPEGTRITVQTRTGDAPLPDDTWSDWSDELADPAGSQMTSPGHRYLQYRITLSTADAARTPLVKIAADSPITCAYTRAPKGVDEVAALCYVTVRTGEETLAYDARGLLIWKEDADGAMTTYDPPDVTDPLALSDLVCDAVELDELIERVAGYVLNDTQREIYLKDEAIISELTAIRSFDGTCTEYCQGQISRIVGDDGTVITDVSFDGAKDAASFTYYRDGCTYIVTDGAIEKVVEGSDAVTEYYRYGLVKSVTDAVGRKEYDYGMPAELSYTTTEPFYSGTWSGAALYEDAGTTYLTLSDEALIYGNGSDGERRVTADETLDAGTYNFTSLTIDPGVTLTLAPGAVIKVLDTTTVYGAVFCGGSFAINAPTVIVDADGSITGGVAIRCDTIENAGIITGNAVMTGTLSSGGEAARDDNFATSVYSSYPGDSDTITVTFPSCDISSAHYRISVANYGLNANAAVYLRVDGSWIPLLAYSGGTINSGAVENAAGWSNVTGMKLYGHSYNGNCVSSSYALYEMQAIIGQPTIDYVHGDPGLVNTSISRPVATVRQESYPASGTFESDVIEIDALTLGAISWDQETPEGTRITVQTRTGDAPLPDDTWSDWSDELADPAGSQMTSPGGNYMQYRIHLSTDDWSITPAITIDGDHALSIGYTKVTDDPLDPYVRVTEDFTTRAYNATGALLWTEDIYGTRTMHDPADPEGSIDLAPLVFDPLYTDALARDIPGRKLSDAQKVITVYDSGNDVPVEVVTAGQSITYFDEGYATRVVDRSGAVQVLYAYDDDKSVVAVELVEARRALEESRAEAEEEIFASKEEALARLEKAERDGAAQIAVKAASLQKEIDAERNRLIDEKSKYNPAVYDLSEFSRAFAEIDGYEARLRRQAEDAYADLADQAAAARTQIEDDFQAAMADLIENDYNKMLADICQKESAPLIYQYYRADLGRDPGNEDLLYWTDRVKGTLSPVTADELKGYIAGLPEYAHRTARKEEIIADLEDFFAGYRGASANEKAALLAPFGLTPDDVVDLSKDEIDLILAWLDSQSLHFGDSAVESVIAMLNDTAPDAFRRVGRNAIAVDVLTGVITAEASGDLVLSLYAMREAAAMDGLTLYSQKITFDDLKDRVTRDAVVAHVDGKHYVVVTTIDEENGEVMYTDPTVGADGMSITVTTAEFMEMWKGYCLSKEPAVDPAAALNVSREKSIRGSGWLEDFWGIAVGFFQKIIAPVATILMMIPSLQPLALALHGLNIIIQTISFVVRTGTLMDVAWAAIGAIGSYFGSIVMPDIYNTIGAAFGGIGESIGSFFGSCDVFVPVKNAFTATMDLFNPLSLAVTDIATGIGTVISMGTVSGEIAATIGANIIAQGIDIGTSFLFQKMQVDPTLTAIGSAFLSGAVMGAVTPHAGLIDVVGGALKYGTMAGIERIGEALDLDANITRLAAMTAGILVEGVLDIDGRQLTYEEIMEDVAPDLFSESSFLVVSEFGSLIGLDPRIAYVGGSGIRSMMLEGFGSGWSPVALWDGIIDGLTDPTTLSVGLSVASDAIGLGPLYGNIIMNLAAGAIEGALENPQAMITGLFRGMFDNFVDSCVRGVTLGLYDPLDGGVTTEWQSRYYLSQLVDFIDIVQEEGIVAALENYMAVIFRDDAIRSIDEVGGIADFLTGNAEIVYEGGMPLKKVTFTDSYALYLDPTTDDIMGRDYDNTQERGTYGAIPDAGGFGLIDGIMQKSIDGATLVYHIRDSVVLDKIDFFGGYNKYSICAMDPEIGLCLDNNGMPLEGIVEDFNGIKILSYEYIRGVLYVQLLFSNPGSGAMNDVIAIDQADLTPEQTQEIINYYIIMNGIMNREYFDSPGYINDFKNRLANVSPGNEDINLVPLYLDNIPKVDADMLEEVVGYQKDLLFENLQREGYIGSDGTLTMKFYDLDGAEGMDLYEEFEEERENIYSLLNGLNRALFERLNDLAKDLADWCLHTQLIAQQILSDMLAEYGGDFPEEMTGLCYSGSGDPFIYLLNSMPCIDVKSIVLVGTQMKGGRWIENENVENVVTIYGSDDWQSLLPNQLLREDFYASDGRLFENNPREIHEVVIELKGLGHTDYFYDPKNANVDPAQRQIQQKASEFIARVTASANDLAALQRFLDETQGIVADRTGGKYIVDLEEIAYVN